MRRSTYVPSKALSAVATIALVSACSKRKERGADDDLDVAKQYLADHFAETCEGAALAAVKATFDRGLNPCDEWQIHAEWSPDVPTELVKLGEGWVTIICNRSRADSRTYYAVRAATGEVQSFAKPGESVKLQTDREAAAAVMRACAHFFD